MELWTREIQTNAQGKIRVDQFVLDEDYNVPDSKGDMQRIIASEAKPIVENVVRVENYVRVSGKLEFQILYVGEGLEPSLSSLEGKLPFEEMVYTEMGEEMYEVKMVRADLRASMIHSRKLRLKALVELELEEQKECSESIPLDVESDIPLYKKTGKKDLLTLFAKRKDTYRIKEEITLPGTKETIGCLLWTDIQNRKLNTKLEMDEFVLQGELQVFCFYESPDGKMDWIEQTVSYQGRIPCQGAEESMYHQVQADLEEVTTELRMDEDGEQRIIGIEATMKILLTVYQEENFEILEDLYSLEKQCSLSSKEVVCEKLVLQNHSKCKLSQKLSLPELKNSVLQICHSSGTIQVEQMKLAEQGVLVEGALHLSFLYVKANDEIPFDTWCGMIPFSHLIECKDVRPNIRYHVSPLLEQISVTMLGGDEVEAKAVLAFHCFFRDSELCEMICDVKVDEFTQNEHGKFPGVIGYIVKPKDDLWTLAKKYRTTKEGIMEVNEMAEETLKVGERILIFKENMSIL